MLLYSMFISNIARKTQRINAVAGVPCQASPAAWMELVHLFPPGPSVCTAQMPMTNGNYC